MTLPPPPPYTDEQTPVTTFTDLGLNARYVDALPAHINTPTPIQTAAIPIILLNPKSDILIEARTGTGKTLAYLLPLLQLLDTLIYPTKTLENLRKQVGTVILVVVPTRELALQTGSIIDGITNKLHNPHWIVSTVLCGQASVKSKDQNAAVLSSRKSEKARLRKGITIVVGTPGRILDHLRQTSSWAGNFKWLVVDEADRLADLGFEPMMREIISHIWTEKDNQKGQIIMASATIKKEMKQYAGVELHEPLLITASLSSTPSSLEHFYMITPTKTRLAILHSLLTSHSQSKTVVFLSCCDSVDFMYYILSKGPLSLDSSKKILRLHGRMTQSDRIFALKAMQHSNPSVLITTDVAARGIDWPDVQLIVQYDVPLDPIDYIHRAGRTARMNLSGKSFLFLMPSEEAFIERFNKLKEEIVIEKVRYETFYNSEKFFAFQDRLLKWVQSSSSVFNVTSKTGTQMLTANTLAKSAFIGFVRAYATHQAINRDVFHIRRLHLGHLAAAHGLSQPPSNFSLKDTHSKRSKSSTNTPTKKPRHSEQLNKSKGGKIFKHSNALICNEFSSGI